MFDSINEVETASLYIICGLALFLSSFSTLIIFISYKELRHGIYGMIIGTAASELYFGFHSLLNGIYGLSRDPLIPLNQVYCKTEATIAVFFWTFWSTLNISIIILFVKRKLKHSKLSKALMFSSITISAVLAGLSYINNAVGVSFAGTCFITKNTDYSTFILAGLFYSLFLVTIIFNIWFCYFRDTTEDRNFINGYNYFLLFTSTMWLPLVTYLVLLCFCNLNISAFYYLAVFLTNGGFLYISYFRLKIEYVQIVFSQGPSRFKFFNCIFFVLGCYPKPKFKDIKRVLNVKYIQSEGQINDTSDTIYSHIMRSTDI